MSIETWVIITIIKVLILKETGIDIGDIPLPPLSLN